MPIELTAACGWLFRITHVANLPWLLAHGLHAPGSTRQNPDFVAIGNADLIERRSRRVVPHPPGGTLSDYIPFYFTPKSPMLFNIKTGYNGIVRRPNEEIAILISSRHAMARAGVRLLFTDRHAYAATAVWTDDPDRLADLIDWDILRRHDFAGDDSYVDKRERYQAEALAHRHVPPAALVGIACVSDGSLRAIEAAIRPTGAHIRAVVRRNWYF